MQDSDLELALTSTNPEELQRLYQKNKDLASTLLENPNTPRTLLLEIIKNEYNDSIDDWLRKASSDVVSSLIWKIPEYLVPPRKRFWQRTTRHGLQEDALVRLFQLEDLPEEFLALASKHPSDAVREKVAAHHKTPASILRELSKDRYNLRVTTSLARNNATPLEVLIRLAQEKELRYSLTQNPNSPEEVLRLAFEHFDLYPEIAKHPNTPVWMKERLLLEGNREVLKILAASPKTPQGILVSLFYMMIPEICSAVLRNPSVPSVLLERAPDALVKELEKNPQKREEALKKLQTILEALQDDAMIALFRTGKVDETLLKSLAQRGSLSADLAILVAEHELTPPEQLSRLVSHANPSVRRIIAVLPNTSSEILYSLGFDSHEAVREAALQNQNFPRERQAEMLKSSVDVRLSLVRQSWADANVLCFLLGDQDILVRRSAVQHPNLSEEARCVLRELNVEQGMNYIGANVELSFLESINWEKYGPWLRSGVVKQSCASSRFLISFFHDPVSDVREQALLHPNMPLRVLIDLAKEPESDIRKFLKRSSWSKYIQVLEGLMNLTGQEVQILREHRRGPEVPVFHHREIVRVADSIDAGVRLKAAKDASSSPQLLEALAYDFNRQVRHAVAGNPKTPDHILFALLRESDAELCRIAQMTIAQKVGDYSPRPGWIENAPLSGPKLLRVLRLSISERTVKNIKDVMQRDPTSLRQRVSQALQRAKEKSNL